MTTHTPGQIRRWRQYLADERSEAAGYRQLAEQAIAAAKNAGDGLRDTAQKLTQIEQRTSEMERLLKEVG